MSEDLEDDSPFTKEQKEECRKLASNYYWKFEDILFHYDGLTVRSCDQGGWPFDAVKISIVSSPEAVVRGCLALLKELNHEDLISG